ASRLVQQYMARASPHRGALVQERKLSGGGIDREGTQRAGRLAFEFINFIGGKQETALRVEFQKRRTGCFPGQAKRDKSAVLRSFVILCLQPEKIDPLAFCAGVRADINQSGIAEIAIAAWRLLSDSFARRAAKKERKNEHM